MKIGLQNGPISGCGNHSQHLARALNNHAPDHQFSVETDQFNDLDIFHAFAPRLPLEVSYRGIPVVLSLSDLHFLRRPHLYTPFQRLLTHRHYRSVILAADRLITLSTLDRDDLSKYLSIPLENIEVIMPLAAPLATPAPSPKRLDAVREKYLLPDHFILMSGVVEPAHHHLRLLESIFEADLGIGVVICGRRTPWSDHLLEFVRKHHMAPRVDFIYEPSDGDLTSLFALCDAFVYLPDGPLESPIAPIVEALRAGVPSILSDTPLNHETAEGGALYLRDGSVAELTQALDSLIYDQRQRDKICDAARIRADHFSARSTLDHLLEVYNSI